MADWKQENRLLELLTPLGKDKLLIRSFEGDEELSQLFHYQVHVVASRSETIDFSKLLGQPVGIAVRLFSAAEPTRFFQGLVNTVSRGVRGNDTTAYTLHIVPALWTLTRSTQSRIFQQQSVPDILKAVLGSLSVAWELQGSYQPREFCVQYRESDFAFASRLMEDEGIFYYFRHTRSGHTLVVADTPATHKDLPGAPVLYYDPDSSHIDEVEIVHSWEKQQTLRSGKTTLWDHSFQLPYKNLEAQDLITKSVNIGQTRHALAIAGNDAWERYDYPGGYSLRFDGISTSGGEQPGELQKIFDDSHRTSQIRMQQEAVNTLAIRAQTRFLGVSAGARFKLDRHYEDNDLYVLTRVHFAIAQSGDSSENGATIPSLASFQCIPLALPFRPQRLTAKPVVSGTQSAVVVGPAGEEIYTDKYGRVKVQFPWDRAQAFGSESSCWVRCAMPWAGKGFGFLSIPRIGHEVLVAFEQGDPDQPVVVGSVYNADTMPGYSLPDNKTVTTFKSRSSPGGGGFNELRFEDKKDSEQIFLHAQKDLHVRIGQEMCETTGHNKNVIVQKDYKEQIDGSYSSTVKGDYKAQVSGTVSLTSDSDQHYQTSANYAIDATQSVHVKGGSNVFLEAASSLSLKVGGNFINLNPGGIFISGTMVGINSGGSAGQGAGCAPDKPDLPAEAGKGVPGGRTPTPRNQWSKGARSLSLAAQSGAAFCDP
jgi:type VI secretion system secreted protein VgrG